MIRQRGFTLLELLVAVSVFAVVSLAAYAGWQQVNIAREKSSIQAARLDELQRTFYWLAEDFTQVVDRPVRDELGQDLPALQVSQIGDNLIEFTRQGWSNPAEGVTPPRSHLQRVAYQFRDGKLLRRYWYHLDRYAEGGDRKRLLLSDVEQVDFRYMDEQRNWTDNWPPLSSTQAQPPALPLAVEIKLKLPDYGELVRVFALPG